MEDVSLMTLRAMEATGIGGTQVKLYNDFVQRGRTTTVTEKDLSNTDIEGLKRVIKAQAEQVKAHGGNPDDVDWVDKTSYGISGDEDLHNLLGAFKFSKNSKGETIIYDTYDYNKKTDQTNYSNWEVLNMLLKDPQKVAAGIGYKKIPETMEVPVIINLGKIE